MRKHKKSPRVYATPFPVCRFLFGNCIFQRFTSFERRQFGSCNGDFFFGSGVDALSLSALFHLKGAKANQLYFIAASQRLRNRIDYSNNRFIAVFFLRLVQLYYCADMQTHPLNNFF